MSELYETLEGFGAAYVATLGMAALCAYLGLLTVLRRIVFTGVALAQLAGAGVAAAFFVVDAPGMPPALVGWATRYGAAAGSLGFSVLGALALQSRPQRRVLTPDALVGLVYAAASAATILLVWRSARGLVELRSILAGEILLSNTGELVLLWMGLFAVATVQLLFRRPFLLVSFDAEFARALGLPERFYQLLFLGSLAVAVALCLQVAGLLLVFAYLVVPGLVGLVAGRQLAESTRLAVASALAGTLGGYLLAIEENLPVGPTIAALLVAVLLASGLAQLGPFVGRLIRAILYGAALLALGVGVLVFPLPDGSAPKHKHGPASTTDSSGPSPQQRLDEALTKLSGFGSVDERSSAIKTLVELNDGRAVQALARTFVDESPEIRQQAAEGLRSLHKRLDVSRRLVSLLASDDAETRVLGARAWIAIGVKEGIARLIAALSDENVPLLLREEIAEELRTIQGGKGFGFDAFDEEEAIRASCAAWDEWWTQSEPRLSWDPSAARFTLAD